MIRSRPGVLYSSALVAVLSACVVEDKKTDTVVVQPPTPRPSAPRSTPAPSTPVDRVDTIVAATGTLNLRNPNFANVNVEVRIGPNSDCSQNPAFGTRQLQKGATWTITANQDVCWRRDVNPDAPNGAWSPWNRQAVGGGSTHEANL